MSFLKLLVPALAIARSAAGAACSGKFTVQNAQDALTVASCAIYDGDVTIDSKTTGDISFDGLTRVKGSFYADGCGLITSLSASTLQTIDDTMYLFGLYNLTSMSFPELTDVKTLAWVTLPNPISSTTLSSGLRVVENLKISDTKFTSLQGIEPTTVSVISIANNAYLNEISLPLKNITSGMVINANGFAGQEPTVTFSDLVFAGALTINNASDIDIGSLKNVSKGLSFASGTFTKLSAPQLGTVGSLTIVDNNDVTSLSFPVLTKTNGALNVQNNTKVTGTIEFPQLTYLNGFGTFLGNFKALSIPKLKLNTGGMLIRSTNKNLDCSAFEQDHNEGRIQGSKFQCMGGASQDQVNEGGNGGSDNSSNNHNAAGHSQVSRVVLIGFSGALAAALALFV